MKLIILASLALLFSVKVHATDDPEAKFKLKFCENESLLEVEFYASPIEKGCIYGLANGEMMAPVVQSVPGGIIVAVQGGAKSIFVKTKKRYADGDMIGPQFVRYTGLKKFTAVNGAVRTVHAFQFLGDAPAAE